MGRTFAVLLFAVTVGGCAAADAMTTTPTSKPAPVAVETNDVGLNPGESMAFEVRVGGVLAGDAAMAVGEIGEFEGHRAVVVKSRAATAGAAALLKHVVDEATTVIDIENGRPLQLETLVEMGDKRTTATARFSGPIADVVYTRNDDPEPHKYKLNFGTNTVHDTHSAMAQIRGWRGKIGDTRSVFVVGGRRLWRVDVKYLGDETIGTAVGNRRCVKFEGSSFRARADFKVESDAPARTFTVWLSDDGDRVPVKVVAHTELGDLTVDLTEYNRP
ncbi:MAG TPA: DUF3108 domain-containing protein [Kofleriaceae bacterium]|nr:DUF3108 domain-containing protein [Kofleriaceae bacterium]